MPLPFIQTLLASDDPAIRFLTLTRVLGIAPNSPEALGAQAQIPTSSRVQTLLSERLPDGTIPRFPYHKWLGAHWILSLLADIGYPSGDLGLIPLRERVLDWLLSPAHSTWIRKIAGKTRICASIEANPLYSLLALGLADERCDELARRLVEWQWPDGGWNCDKNPSARNSSYHESLIPLRALALHSRLTGNRDSADAAGRAAEIFLKRRLFRRQSDGQVIKPDFVRLHYPHYWHYDFLFGLKVLAEASMIDDERCREALDLLESKRLQDGGFPAQSKYYQVSEHKTTGRSLVDWGGTSQQRMNPFVTVEALFVLREAGRLDYDSTW